MDSFFPITKSRHFIIFFLALFLFIRPATSHAIVIDLLGEIASPLIGPAKDKVKGMMRYVWMQPYGGYASGSSDQKRVNSAGAVTSATGLDVEGIMYGARGGFLIMDTFRVGLDYTSQNAKRTTLVENTTGGFVKQSTSGTNSMLGLCLGFDIPYTPLQGMATKYFKATLHGDSASNGDGWGAGVSFVLKSPFIFILEMRKLSYSSAPDMSGKKATGTVSQYYGALSFMLF